MRISHEGEMDGMKGIVDRFEGEFVVIEIEGQTQDIEKSVVHESVKAGDCVVLVEGIWETDEAETTDRSAKVKGLMEELWED
ncbi:MAG: DUF3006 domain-containing protein [Candidatus Cohnella colombiensis]|uniref:DUF3006 domain-containing protein n=1 Tax=Candidatus Cohnella colombiensis TaxID=3121368 RepID=A0AA95EU36_9BACL|nr:MAG: DUF3006 domain-containing protein [Cohnella sp.]